MTKTSGPRNPSKSITPNTVTMAMVRSLVSMICLTHQRVQTDELDTLYFLGLSDLSLEQFQQLPKLVIRETEFWPSPGRLRRLLSLPTSEEITQVEALADLQRALDTLEPASRDLRMREKLVERIKTDMGAHVITKTIAALGGGTLASGIELLCGHPRFTRPEEGREPLGLELNTIKTLESRWIAAWKENRKQ